MGLEEKTISSSEYTGGSAELVSDPNNILFSSHTYRFLMFLLLMLHSVRRRHIGGTQVPFKVVEMEGKYLKQPVGNNECEFYVIWAMLRSVSIHRLVIQTCPKLREGFMSLSPCSKRKSRVVAFF